MTGLAFQLREDDFSEEEKVIRHGLNDYAMEKADLKREFIGAFCRNGKETIGGVTAHLVGETLSVKLLWVHEGYRGQAIATRLMNEMEDCARSKKCKVAFVDTLSYQAPQFYEKIGYQEVARIKDFYPAGYDRIFFKKDLT